jgi:hypothetical protein
MEEEAIQVVVDVQTGEQKIQKIPFTPSPAEEEPDAK